MITAKDLDAKIIFRNGEVSFVDHLSMHSRKVIKGLRANLKFEDITYTDFEGISRNTELDIYLFITFKSSFTSLILSKLLGGRLLFKELENKSIELPVNPEPEYNDNSIYLNNSHTPIDIPRMAFFGIEQDQILCKLDMEILGRFEDSLPSNLKISRMIKLNLKI
jgi:hypothetical protein